MSELNEEIKRLQELLINIKEERAKHKHDFLIVIIVMIVSIVIIVIIVMIGKQIHRELFQQK